MLIRALRSIRSKPKAVREKYALGIAIVITAAVITLWVKNFPVDLAPDDTDLPIVAEETVSEVRSATQMLGELKDEISKLSEAVTESASTTPAVVASTTVSTTTTPELPPEVRSEVRIATTTNGASN